MATYSEELAIAIIESADVGSVRRDDKTIVLKRFAGIKVIGAIDFLRGQKGYTVEEEDKEEE